MAIIIYLSIITLNVNGLNAPIKRRRVAEWIRKQDLTICCLQETHFRPKDIHKLKVKGQKKILHANNRDKKKKGVAVLISEKTDFKARKVTRDKKGHYRIKASVQQNDILL